MVLVLAFAVHYLNQQKICSNCLLLFLLESSLKTVRQIAYKKVLKLKGIISRVILSCPSFHR